MLRQFLLSFTAVFVALDIIGTLPLYAGMTREMPALHRKRVLNTSIGVAFCVALVFVFLGTRIFDFLGITLPDFRIAGGIVLLLISLSDLIGKNEAESRGTGSTGVVPLAVPLITGPGVLTTLVLQVGSAGYAITLAALVVNYALAWAFLQASDRITAWIGKDGSVVLSKIASLLLAAIAVAMVRGGVMAIVRGV